MRRVRACVTVWWALGVAACGPGTPGAAIDRPVRSLTAVAGALLAAAPASLVAIPGTSGAADFLDLRGVLTTEDGSMAVVDAGVPRVYLFDGSSRLLTTIGRAGSGPGEFREPTLVTFWGDSLAVFDPPQRRVSYFRPDGSFIRQRIVSVPGTMAPSIVGIRPDGVLIFKGTVLEGPPAGGSLQSLRAVVLTIDAQDRVDTLAVIDDGLWRPDGPLWYAWRSAVAVTDSGIWYGSGGRPELRFRRWDRSEGPAFQWTSRTRAVDQHDREVIAEIAGAHRAVSALTAPDRFADSIPYFGRLLPDPTGGAWVIGPSAPFAAPDSAWFVDPPSGTISGVALPVGFRPTQAGADFLLGLQSDADGVGRPARFRLGR